MSGRFGDELDAYLKQAGLPLRRVASSAMIPHQTLFNWTNGTQPRWHPALSDDLRRLGMALGLDETQLDRLLHLAGCLPARGFVIKTKENTMTITAQTLKGWFPSGSHPTSYEMGLDHTVTYGSNVSAYIKGEEAAEGFGTLMQIISANMYRNVRIELSAVVRSADVKQWAGLWMRVDEREHGPSSAFDNMQDRPIAGTSEWTRYAVVLDVAPSADKIAFGILLAGPGQVWLADVRLEPVSADVPTTNVTYPQRPVNLDFTG